LEIIKENDMVLGTGHISVEEIYAVTARARQMGVKVTITHPLNTFFGSSLTQAQQKELVAMGAYLEQTFVTCLPDLGGMNPKLIVEHIKAVGEEHCILSTDFGQPSNPSPPEGFRMMVAYMLESGLSEKELQVLIKDNPSKLLGLG
jgi:predicted TIM-barrel fold metal-dependent hydrolase